MKYVVIIIFALAVVLLGANELHNKYAPKPTSSKRKVNKQIVQDLQGVVSLEERTGQGKGSYKFKELRKRESKAVPEKKQSVLEKDELDPEDRGELRKLISKIVP